MSVHEDPDPTVRTAVLDACVLYPAPLRDILIETAKSGLFRARWTERIHDEWTRNVARDRPHLAEPLWRTRRLMNDAVLECLVTGHEALIDTLALPDPDDRHVLAAAIRCGADTIVTINLKDFPASILDRHEIRAQHPDAFLQKRFLFETEGVVAAARTTRARMKKPSKTVSEYLGLLEAQGLRGFAAALRPYSSAL